MAHNSVVEAYGEVPAQFGRYDSGKDEGYTEDTEDGEDWDDEGDDDDWEDDNKRPAPENSEA